MIVVWSMSVLEYLFALLVAFQVKHFIADYPLQTEYMLGKFKDTDWRLPLALHCGVHAFFTAVIAYYAMAPYDLVVALALLDFGIHFLMDRVKASPTLLGRFKPLYGDAYLQAKALAGQRPPSLLARKALRDNKLFWWALGFDQMVHHLTDYVVIFFILRAWLGYR